MRSGLANVAGDPGEPRSPKATDPFKVSGESKRGKQWPRLVTVIIALISIFCMFLAWGYLHLPWAIWPMRTYRVTQIETISTMDDDERRQAYKTVTTVVATQTGLLPLAQESLNSSIEAAGQISNLGNRAAAYNFIGLIK